MRRVDLTRGAAERLARANRESGVHSASSVAGRWVLPVRRRAPARHHLGVSTTMLL
jgi:hypothetical protein